MWFERAGRSALVRTVWAAEVEVAGAYPLTGSEYWGISFISRPDGTSAAELDGPSLHASVVDSHVGDRYWGVELASHVGVRGISKDALAGRTITLDVVDGAVRVGDDWWTVPPFDDLDSLEGWVDGLVRAGALIDDADIRAALAGDRVGATPRTWQRRFRRTVGLTSAQLDQLRRAQHAFVLLQEGMSPAAAAATAGFSDQPHLTRALRMIRGQTPAAIIAAHHAR